MGTYTVSVVDEPEPLDDTEEFPELDEPPELSEELEDGPLEQPLQPFTASKPFVSSCKKSFRLNFILFSPSFA